MQRIVVTGCSGFVGRHLIKSLSLNPEIELSGVSRGSVKGLSVFQTRDLAEIEVTPFLNKDIVIHLAGLAHNRSRALQSRNFKKENLENTIKCLKMAQKAGVKHFIFISTVNVYNLQSPQILDEDSDVEPVSEQAKSKLAAENAIKDFCATTDISYTIIRCPLVYALDAPGNIQTLSKFVKYVRFLPFKAFDRKCTYLGVNNLVDFIETCAFDNRSLNQSFVISDNFGLSVSEMVELIRDANSIRTININVPTKVLRFIASLFGKQDLIDKIESNYEINSTKAKRLLGWTAKYSAKSNF